MKSVESRIEKLEKSTAGKALEPSELLIIDDTDQKAEGVIVRMPTPEADGIARLADGTERAVMYESDWRDIDYAFPIVFLDTRSDPEAKLRIRRGDIAYCMLRIECENPHFPEGNEEVIVNEPGEQDTEA